MNFHNLEATKLNGEKIPMSNYAGKTIIVVNTASKCGLTPQFEGLENLYKKYQDKGLVILGFPCNQFAGQEPGNAKEIAEFCQVNYGVTFPMFAKVDVNGENTDPIFQYLKSEKPGLFGKGIKWNFTKFIVDKNGNAVKRFSPTTKPEKMESTILKML